MIPANAITEWATTRPWPSRFAIEQDLLLARVIAAIYQHPELSRELVLWGGTCLHQVHLAAPRRYSEDLDFVRRTHTGIGPVLDALRGVASEVGLDVAARNVGEHPKMTLRGAAEDDPARSLRIKVEINTHETSPVLPLLHVPFHVRSAWFTGSANVLTFAPAELVCTKIRALYQRKKGRDLFDLWLALTEMGLDPADIVGCFTTRYRPAGYTAKLAMANLDAKLTDRAFRTDLEPLVGVWPDGYDIDAAATLIRERLLQRT